MPCGEKKNRPPSGSPNRHSCDSSVTEKYYSRFYILKRLDFQFVPSNLTYWDTVRDRAQYVLERCPYKRGYYDKVAFMTDCKPVRIFAYSSTGEQFEKKNRLQSTFMMPLAKTRFTLVFQLHLILLIQSTKTLSFPRGGLSIMTYTGRDFTR